VTPGRNRTLNRTAKLLASAAILTIAIGFVLKYVFRYYLHYNQAAFTDPALGASNYWTMRAWLLMPLTGGLVALLAGPGSSGQVFAPATLGYTAGPDGSFSEAWR